MISPSPTQSELRIVCAWCGRVIRPSTAARGALTSHGICSDCLKAAVVELPSPTAARRARAINDYILDRRYGDGNDEPIAFYCECGVQACHRAAWLTAGEYADAREDPAWLALADGHRPVLS